MGAPRLERRFPHCHYGRLAVRPEIALMMVVVIVTANFVLHGSRFPSWLGQGLAARRVDPPTV